MIHFIHYRFIPSFILLLVLLASGCSEKANKIKKAAVTSAGYPYVHHIKNKGPKATSGDEIAYHQIVFKNDTLLQSTYYYEEPRRVVLPHRDSVPNPPRADFDAFFLMAEGDSLTVYQPLKDFDKATLPKGVLLTDTFIYHIKLVDLKNKKQVKKEKEALRQRQVVMTDSIKNFIADRKSGKLKDELVTTASGLQYVILKPGTNQAAESGKFLDVHYSGFLADGTPFDNTFDKGRPYTFRIDRGLVIPGWDEGVQQLKEGGQMILYVPYQLGYGDEGNPPTIPAKSDLVYFVELLNVRF